MSSTLPLRHRLTVLLALMALCAAAVGLIATQRADAEPVEATMGEFRWKISTYAWGSSSLIAARGTSGNAAIAMDGDVPVEFVVSDGEGTYDPATGATDIAFEGEFFIGNDLTGNYGFKWIDPRIVVDADGNGALIADFASRGPGSAEWRDADADVTIVTFTVDSALDDGSNVTWTATPDFPEYDWEAFWPDWEGAPLHGFPQEFLDLMSTSLSGHFRETLSGTPPAPNANNPNKPPAPITLAFSYDAPEPPPDGINVTVDPLSNADPDGQDFSVQGSGFDLSEPGIYVAFGVAAGDWWLDEAAFQDAVYLPPAALQPDGSFDLVLEDIAAVYDAGDLGEIDCREIQCSVLTMKAHGSGDRTQDTITNVTFVGGDNPKPPTPPEPPVPATPGGEVGGDLVPGGTGIVTMWGFGPSTSVDGWLYSEPESLGSVIADVNGMVNFSFTVPGPGEHRIEGHGVDINGEPIVVTVRFTVPEVPVDETPVAQPAAAVTPTGSLPFTGTSPLVLVAGALALLAAGGALALRRRREDSPTV